MAIIHVHIGPGALVSEHVLTFCFHRLIRESLPDAVVGLFVHTPFPSSEVFRCLPRKLSAPVRGQCDDGISGRREILDGMLGANLVCFQVCLA